jgi:AhpD family alkylhydroperoxidase
MKAAPEALCRFSRLLAHKKYGREFMKAFLTILALSILPVAASSQSVKADDIPNFFKSVAPPDSLGPAMQEYGAVFGPKALDSKTKELIGLGVAAQIPCVYCIYAHTLNAKRMGATDDQIKEAVAAAALTRKWSTELNGNMYDFDSFKKEMDAINKAMAQKTD